MSCATDTKSGKKPAPERVGADGLEGALLDNAGDRLDKVGTGLTFERLALGKGKSDNVPPERLSC